MLLVFYENSNLHETETVFVTRCWEGCQLLMNGLLKLGHKCFWQALREQCIRRQGQPMNRFSVYCFVKQLFSNHKLRLACS